VILPRLLWQEQQRIAQLAEESRSRSVQQQQQQAAAPLDTFLGGRHFDAAFDFEWWLDDERDVQQEPQGAADPGRDRSSRRRWLDRMRDVVRRR